MSTNELVTLLSVAFQKLMYIASDLLSTALIIEVFKIVCNYFVMSISSFL